MDNNLRPDAISTAPCPSAGGQPLPSQGMPTQNTTYQPQAVAYANAPFGAYVYNPLLQQPPTTAALNATERTYHRPRYTGGFGSGPRIMVYIVIGVYAMGFLFFITGFLVVFFTMYNKNKDFGILRNP